jgi:asparagine synthase (glutamine-hydrolysing)
MCGIFLYKGNSEHWETLSGRGVLTYRGPDSTTIQTIGDNSNFIGMEFYRLAINEQSDSGDQPMRLQEYICMCNGEIFNYRELIQTYSLNVGYNESDCKVILHLFLLFDRDINKVLDVIDGDFAIVIINTETYEVIITRDTFGVRPMFIGHNGDASEFILASEMKAIGDMKYVSQVKPNCTMHISDTDFVYNQMSDILCKTCDITLKNVRDGLISSVNKRLPDTPQIMGCLLSGGLDSSLIASLLSLKTGYTKLKTFSIGQTRDSPDLVAARIVATFLDTDHHELVISQSDMFDAIPEVIKSIGSYDTTTVRASTPMYMLCKYINSTFPEIKILFSGEGSDELFGGYKYFRQAPSDTDFQNETARLLSEIHYYDGLRADRCAGAHGLELRVPFLDKVFVSMIFNADISKKNDTKHMEKWLLRDAFRYYLPDSILFRAKEAFSDGVSNIHSSWHTYIQTRVPDEHLHYSDIFDSFYPGRTDIIPGLWKPKWTSVSDPSAREL